MKYFLLSPILYTKDESQVLKIKSGTISTDAKQSHGSQGVITRHKLYEKRILTHRRSQIKDTIIDKELTKLVIKCYSILYYTFVNEMMVFRPLLRTAHIV